MTKETIIDEKAVLHMAELSRLYIAEDEIQSFSLQFSQIINLMDIIQAVPTENVEPMFSPLEQQAWQRNDKEHDFRTHEQIMRNAPETDGQYFIVPKII